MLKLNSKRVESASERKNKGRRARQRENIISKIDRQLNEMNE